MQKLLILTITLSAVLSLCPDDKYCTKCNATKCESCVMRFFDAAGLCTAPTTAIANCYGYSNATTCSSCNFGYNLTANACVKVGITGCLKSTGTGTAEKCHVCEKGYKAETDGKCGAKTNCTISNCEACSTETTTETCLYCKDDYVQLVNTCIKENISNCQVENSSKKCIGCLPGFYQDKDGKCAGVGSTYTLTLPGLDSGSVLMSAAFVLIASLF